MPDPATTVRGLRAMLKLDVVDVSVINDAVAIIEPRANEAHKMLDPQLILDVTVKIACWQREESFYGVAQDREIADARAIAVGLLREMTNLSMPEVAGVMGRPNHSSCFTMRSRFIKLTHAEPDRDFIATVDKVRLAVIKEHDGSAQARSK